MFGRRLLAARRTVFCMVVSLLVSQSALASYLCPAMSPSPHDMATMATGMPCDGSDAAQPALCHQHAADPGQVVQPAQAVPPSLHAIVQILVIPAAAPTSDVVAMPRASAREAWPPPDPVFLATRRLRV
jgi:hypothetical protein